MIERIACDAIADAIDVRLDQMLTDKVAGRNGGQALRALLAAVAARIAIDEEGASILCEPRIDSLLGGEAPRMKAPLQLGCACASER